jgi:hypothetical protein
MLKTIMNKINGIQLICLVGIIALGLITIIGSGGGGGGGGGISPSITYTGATGQANVTDTNAQALIAGAFQAGRSGSVVSGIGAVETGGDGHIVYFRTLKLPQMLENVLLQVDPSSLSGGPIIGATQSETGSIPGPCGGTVSYTIQYNDQTGVFSGSFNFSNYCDSGVSISGKANVNGTVDLFFGTIETITMEFSNLSDGSSTMDGTIVMNFISVPMTTDFDVLLKDNFTGKVYWARDYVLELTDYGSYVEVVISSGTYYDPDYGYVILETPTAFRIDEGDDWPSSGVLVVTGSGNTKARLTAISNTQCQIDADLNGDDVYEWGPVTKNWDEL